MNTNAAPLTAQVLADKLTQLGSVSFLETAIPRALIAVAAYAILLMLLRVGRGRPMVRRFSLTLNLLGLACILQLTLGACVGGIFPFFPRILTAAVVFFLSFLLLKIAEVTMFEFIFIRQGLKPAPVVLRDIARAVLTAILLAIIIKGFFPQINFNVLAVSSLVVGFVLANATQDTLGSLMAGLAMNAENSFSIGDWIAIGDRIGKVTDITWRSTRLRTKNMEDLIVPNSTISKEILINFSRPTPELRTRIRIGIDYGVAPNRVREAVLETMREVEGIDPTPAPVVRVVDFADSSIIYEILFFIHEYDKLEAIRADLMNLLWYRFKRSDISIPFPIRDVRLRQVTREDERAAEQDRAGTIARLFAGLDLFAPLSEDERKTLAEGCSVRIYAADESIVKQNDPGHSLFIIQSGKTGVFVDQQDRKRVKVGELGPGAFFGERSLLTGENRSATVTALQDTELVELGKETFRNILKAKPEMAEYLGTILAQRDQSRATAVAGADTASGVAKANQKRSQFVSRILNFFGMA